MSTAAAVQIATTKTQGGSSGSALLLQRKCACGGSSGLAAECESCQSKRLLGKSLQPKLRIGAANDEYEREADRVAEQVMRAPDAMTTTQAAPSNTAPLVQRRVAANTSAGIEAVPQAVHDVLSSPGQPLNSSTREFFEPRFGYDFAHVRVHADAAAAASAHALNALAYTVGNHVVVGAGQYRPDRLLAHELAHVVQQSDRGSAPVALQRASVNGADDAAGNITDEGFLNEVVDLLEGIRGTRDLIASFGLSSSNVGRLDGALKQLNSHWNSMDQHDKFGPGEFYGLLEYAGQVVRLFELVVPEASAQVSTQSDLTNLTDLRRQVAALSERVLRLQGKGFIVEKAEKIADQRAMRSEMAQEQQALEAQRRETVEGRREDALAFTRAFVADEHKWWPDQAPSTAGVYAEELGAYYLREKRLGGADIQLILETLAAEDSDTLDRALYQGRLLAYLFSEGVTGLSAATLPVATGSGFHDGFEFSWRDLVARQPINLPSFSAPTARDIFSYELGAKWGVLVGIKDGAVATAQDIRSLFQVETYTQLYELLTSSIWDEGWRYRMGSSFAVALHAYLQDVGDDSAFEIGKRFGRLIGQAVFEILSGLLTAGAAKIASKALRATKWGTALLDFADDVAHGMRRKPGSSPEESAGNSAPESNLPEHENKSLPAIDPMAREAANSADLEASVAVSSHLESSAVPEQGKRNEAAWVDAHPEAVTGSAPDREAKIGESGEHRIVEKGNGGCARHSSDAADVPCPLIWTSWPNAPVSDPLPPAMAPLAEVTPEGMVRSPSMEQPIHSPTGDDLRTLDLGSGEPIRRRFTVFPRHTPRLGPPHRVMKPGEREIITQSGADTRHFDESNINLGPARLRRRLVVESKRSGGRGPQIEEEALKSEHYPAREGSYFAIYDVGSGQLAVRVSTEEVVIYDAGSATLKSKDRPRLDDDELQRLRKAIPGEAITELNISHLDEDHFNFVADLAARFEIQRLVINHYMLELGQFSQLARAIRQTGNNPRVTIHSYKQSSVVQLRGDDIHPRMGDEVGEKAPAAERPVLLSDLIQESQGGSTPAGAASPSEKIYDLREDLRKVGVGDEYASPKLRKVRRPHEEGRTHVYLNPKIGEAHRWKRATGARDDKNVAQSVTVDDSIEDVRLVINPDMTARESSNILSSKQLRKHFKKDRRRLTVWVMGHHFGSSFLHKSKSKNPLRATKDLLKTLLDLTAGPEAGSHVLSTSFDYKRVNQVIPYLYSSAGFEVRSPSAGMLLAPERKLLQEVGLLLQAPGLSRQEKNTLWAAAGKYIDEVHNALQDVRPFPVQMPGRGELNILSTARQQDALRSAEEALERALREAEERAQGALTDPEKQLQGALRDTATAVPTFIPLGIAD